MPRELETAGGWRYTPTVPIFESLTALPGHPEMREVDGQWMGREQYEVCEWHVVKEEIEDGKPYRYWAATLAGLNRWSQLRNERHLSWKERNETDQESDEYYRNLGKAKP